MLDWYQKVFEIIELRSFSNLWYWIVLAVSWSMASHWILGVPYDMITRARRNGGQAAQDVEMILRANLNRYAIIKGTPGIVFLAVNAFLFTSLAILGFVYRFEFSQALFLLGFPLLIVLLLSARLALRLRPAPPTGEELYTTLFRHRVLVQGIGMVAVVITTLWGVFFNLSNPWRHFSTPAPATLPLQDHPQQQSQT